MKAFSEMGWIWSSPYLNDSARWRRIQKNPTVNISVRQEAFFQSIQFSPFTETRAMPLLATLQMSAEVDPAGEAISSLCNNVQPLRLRELNCRQVARAQRLSVPHDTRLTSGDAPNQEAEICHLGGRNNSRGCWVEEAKLFHPEYESQMPVSARLTPWHSLPTC